MCRFAMSISTLACKLIVIFRCFSRLEFLIKAGKALFLEWRTGLAEQIIVRVAPAVLYAAEVSGMDGARHKFDALQGHWARKTAPLLQVFELL